MLSEVGEIKEVTNTCTSKFKINDWNSKLLRKKQCVNIDKWA